MSTPNRNHACFLQRLCCLLVIIPGLGLSVLHAEEERRPTQPSPEKEAVPAETKSTRTDPGSGEEEDELVRKLLRRAAGQGDDEEVVQRIMRLMEASRLRLAGQFDPGETTQQIQRRILEEMDEAIQRSRQSASRSSSSSRQQRPGERRPPGRPQGRRQTAKEQNTGQQQQARNNQGGQDERATKGQVRERGARRKTVDAARRWGNLPPRDREAVLQGIKDEYLPKFKDLIERYYKALSVTDERQPF